jgi:hypothetical protein
VVNSSLAVVDVGVEYIVACMIVVFVLNCMDSIVGCLASFSRIHQQIPREWIRPIGAMPSSAESIWHPSSLSKDSGESVGRKRI